MAADLVTSMYRTLRSSAILVQLRVQFLLTLAFDCLFKPTALITCACLVVASFQTAVLTV